MCSEHLWLAASVESFPGHRLWRGKPIQLLLVRIFDPLLCVSSSGFFIYEMKNLFISPKYIGTVCVAFQKMGRDASQNRLQEKVLCCSANLQMYIYETSNLIFHFIDRNPDDTQ